MSYKIIPPKGLKEVAVKTERGTKLYKASRDGLIHVDNPNHARQMKDEGLGVAGIGGVTKSNVGYPCECGFASLFVVCSRCGRDNRNEET